MKILKCPQCNIEMIYDERKEFWRCPKCGGEWWEDTEGLAGEAEQAKADNLPRVVPGTYYFLPHTVTPVLPPVCEYIPGGGSKKAGRRRKSSRQFKVWTQRYMMV